MRILADKPRVEPSFDGKWEDWNGEDWVLIEPWSGIYELESYSFELHIEPGWVTDFGSVLFGKDVVNKSGSGIVAFIPHDMGYNGEFVLSTPERARADWDLAMDEALKWVGMGWFLRNVCYIGVRTCGYCVAWRLHTPQSIANARSLCRFINNKHPERTLEYGQGLSRSF